MNILARAVAMNVAHDFADAISDRVPLGASASTGSRSNSAKEFAWLGLASDGGRTMALQGQMEVKSAIRAAKDCVS